MTILSRLAAALVIAGASLIAPASAQDFPDRLVRIVVPYPAGGGVDGMARALGEGLSQIWKQPVIIENKPGASTMIGGEFVARAPADGYTLGMATVSTHGSNPAVYGSKLRYHAVKDFAPITNVATTPSVFAVHPGTPAKDMKELIALAQAHPGKYSFASPGIGSLGHANIEHFMALSKMNLLHVPYKGAGQAMTDAMAGQVTAITDNLPSALPNIQSGKLRALAVLSEKRSPSLPEVPTYGELGFPQMGGGGWFGVVAPAGTPPEVVARLNAAIHKGMKHPEFIKQMEASGSTLIPGTPEAFAQQIQQAMERYERVAKMAKISLD